MNRHFILFAIVFLSVCSGFAKTFDIDISTGRPAAANEAYYHGETIEFRAVRGRVAVTNVEYGCIYYQTNGMGQAWWRTDGLVFHPTNDVGAASYRFFLDGRDDLGRDWHANGLLRLLPSPGFAPNTIELPVARLDFAAVDVLNPPWTDPDYSTNNTALVDTIETVAPQPGDYATVSNLAVHAVQTEADPVWQAERYSKADNIIFMRDAARSWTCTKDDGTEVVMEWRGIIDNPNEVSFRWECATNFHWYLKYTVCNIHTNSSSYVEAEGGCWVFGWPHRVKAGGRGDQLLFYPIDSDSMQFDYSGTTYTLARPLSSRDDCVALRYAYLHNLAPYATTNYAVSAAASAAIAATNALGALAWQSSETDPTVPSWAKDASKPSYSYSEIAGTPTTWPYTAITNAPWLASLAPATNYTDAVAAGLSIAIATNAAEIAAISGTPSLEPVATSGSYNDLHDTPNLDGYATTAALDNYLPLSGGVVTGNVFVAQQTGDTNDILVAVGEQTYGRFSVPAIGTYPDRSIDYEDERTIAALLKEDDMPLLRLEKIENGRVRNGLNHLHTNLVSIAYEKAELDMDGLGHVRIDTNGVIIACDIRWPTPPEGTNYICGTMALREEIPEVPTEWDYTAITNAPWLTSYTETDPTVPSWAKVTTPPYLTSETDPTVPSAANAATNYTDSVAARYLPLTGGELTGDLLLPATNEVSVGGLDAGSTHYGYGYIYHDSSYLLTLPNKSGTFALTADVAAATNALVRGPSVYFATCATAAATRAKVLVFDSADISRLGDIATRGNTLFVKFDKAQTYNGVPQLSINGTTYLIYMVGATGATRYEWVAGEVVQFVYDGERWMLVDAGRATTSYYGVTKLTTSVSSTSTSTALTPASLSGYIAGTIDDTPVYATNTAHAVGARARYGNYTWECTNAVAAGVAWNEADWRELPPLQTQLDDLKPSGPIATNSVVRATSGDACRVSLASGATLSATLDVEGVPVMGIVEPAGAYSVSPSIHLLGYGTWPTNSFQAVFWKVGQTTFANVLSEL